MIAASSANQWVDLFERKHGERIDPPDDLATNACPGVENFFAVDDVQFGGRDERRLYAGRVRSCFLSRIDDEGIGDAKLGSGFGSSNIKGGSKRKGQAAGFGDA